MSINRVIGKNNSLIWNLPNDLKRFKQLTTGSSVVMGRKTYESIGRPLPNRRNIVISRDQNLFIDGCDVVSSLSESLLLCNNDCFIIGGGEIYKQTLPIADKIYVTLIEDKFEGDTYFPELDSSWHVLIKESFTADKKNNYNYSFIEYERYQF